MSNVVKAEAQIQAEEAFDWFVIWMKRITLYACIFLGVVVFGCNSGVVDKPYPAYNGEQYEPTNMGND